MIWMRFYGKQKVSQKIFTYFIILMGVTIAVLSAIVISISSGALERQTDEAMIQMVGQVTGSIDAQILRYEDILYYISKEPSIEKFLISQDTQSPEGLRQISNYEQRNEGIVGIMVIRKDGTFLSDSMITLSRDSLLMEDWYQQGLASDQALLISTPIGRNIKALDDSVTSDDVVSLVKQIKNESGEMTGVILMDIHLRIFESMIAEAVIGQEGFVYVQDQSGNVVYTKVNPIVYHIPPSVIEQSISIINFNVHDEGYKISYKTSEYTGWKTVGVFPISEAMESVKQIQMMIMMTTIILIIVSFIISYFVAGTITKPIDHLKNLMLRAREGELDLHYDGGYEDEVGQLGQSFNTMIASIKGLIEMVTHEQQAKREAELEIFRAQIKPHFLYNTLDTIHWLVKEERKAESVKVIKALTKLFRITLSKGKDHITLEDELNHVSSYLTIQSIRYGEKFSYDIHCPPNLRQLQVTRLILQPLVENAIYHGIKEKRGKGDLQIRVHKTEDHLIMEVVDNGVGMKEDRLAHLNDVMNRKKPRENEYGLVNVNEKIKLSYGEYYGVRLKSQLGIGTQVTIIHPIL